MLRPNWLSLSGCLSYAVRDDRFLTRPAAGTGRYLRFAIRESGPSTQFGLEGSKALSCEQAPCVCRVVAAAVHRLLLRNKRTLDDPD